MGDIRTLPAVDKRVETGPTQFGDDWPGVFIRGDNAAYYAMSLRELLANKDSPDPLARHIIIGLYHLLRDAIVGPAKNVFPPMDGPEGA